MPENTTLSLSKVKLGASVVVLLGVLAGFTFITSFWGESHFQGGPTEDLSQIEYISGGDVQVGVNEESSVLSDQTLESGMSFSTGEDSELAVQTYAADLLRLYPNTEVVFEEVDLESDPIQAKVRLVSGEVWVSDLQGTVKWVLEADQVRIEPENGSTYVSFDDDIYVLAAHHPTEVSFLEDDTVLNSYLVTESHEVSIQPSSVTSVLGQLRYTKLTKEFPFVYEDEDDWDDRYTSALKEDERRLAEVYSTFVSSLRRNGNGGLEEGSFRHDLQGWYRTIRSYLTVSDQHLLEIEEDEDLELLLQALYLIVQGEDATASDRLQAFKVAAQDFETLDKLAEFDRVFKSVYYGDAFYEAKSLVREVQYERASEEERLVLSMQFLRELLNEAYDLLDRGDRTEAKLALEAYNETWQSLINRIDSDLPGVVQGLTAERQILQNLLYREDTFYAVSYYEVLSDLEDKILTLTAEEYDLNEERQAFAQDKLRALSRLIDLTDDELVSVEDSLDLGYLLMSDARDLLNDVTTETAVKSYFLDQLKEFSLMFEFIGSSDFVLSEGSFEDKFQDYLEKEGDMEALADYILGLTGEEEETELTLEEAQAEAEEAFDKEGIDYIALVPLGDQGYRLFQVEGGRVDLVEFEANYDRVSEIIYDLEVNGEVFSAGVKLEDLGDAIVQATTEESDDEEEEIEIEQGLSSVEAFAIDFAKTALLSEGLEISDDEISIVDLNENLFAISYEMEYQGQPVQVEFLFDADTNEASEILAVFGEMVVTVDEELPVSEMEALIEVNLEPDLEEEVTTEESVETE